MTLTIGLIGCGRWGTIHHATLMSLKQEGYLDRLIVCDIDATARDAVEADAHYASIDAMLTSEQARRGRHRDASRNTPFAGAPGARRQPPRLR